MAFGSRGGQHRHTIGQQFEFLLRFRIYQDIQDMQKFQKTEDD